MSANLDLVRSIHADWERGDFSFAEWADPEIELVFTGGWPDAGSGMGLANMAHRWGDWLSAWQDFRAIAQEYRQIDEERVLVLTRFQGRGKTSGLDLTDMRTEPAALFHVRDGKVRKLVLYFDRNVALGDLGLAPETGSA
jgi:ketosteroid isomerase-like protein